MQTTVYPRRIRSYACRAKRLTSFQKRQWDNDWPFYGLSMDSQEPFDFEKIFGRMAPRVLEIGFGTGESLLKMAQAFPEKDFIGIEVYHRGVISLLTAVSKAKLNNLRLIFQDAVEVLTHRIPSESLEGIQIFFADPWPKTRHHKRRLIQPSFVSMLAIKLKLGGELHLATDWTHYAQSMMSVVSQNNHFQNLAGDHCFSARSLDRPLTKYEKRAVDAGRTLYELRFQKLY